MRIQFKHLLSVLMTLALIIQPTTVIAHESQGTVVRKIVVIDAGHGGPDSGARGEKEIHEKDITLAVSHKLAILLREAGVTVIETRQTDMDLSTGADKANRNRHRGDLKGRLRIVKNAHPDAFISIHCNAGPSPAWRGAQVLHLEGNVEGEELARGMQKQFRQLLLPTHRQVEDNKTLYLLKRIDGPAVLAEIGFITNPEEAMSLTKPSYQERVALAMYIALAQYFDAHGTRLLDKT